MRPRVKSRPHSNEAVSKSTNDYCDVHYVLSMTPSGFQLCNHLTLTQILHLLTQYTSCRHCHKRVHWREIILTHKATAHGMDDTDLQTDSISIRCYCQTHIRIQRLVGLYQCQRSTETRRIHPTKSA